MRYPRRGLSASNRPTLYRPRNLPVAVIPLFVAVAVLGYAAGHLRPGSAADEADRTAPAALVRIEYPAGWKRAAGGARVPGLAIAHAQLIDVARPGANAGLIVGTLPATQNWPLP